MTIQNTNILSYTNLYPNSLRPNFGIFIKNRLEAYSDYSSTQIDVMAPVPYFPNFEWPKQWGIYGKIPIKEKQNGRMVYHPRYLVIPKLGMWTQGLSMYLSTLPLARQLHQKRQYQLLDAHWVYPDGWAAVHIAKKLKIPVVLSARGNDINEYLDFRNIRPMIKWCLQECDHVISVCQALKDLMVTLGISDSNSGR